MKQSEVMIIEMEHRRAKLRRLPVFLCFFTALFLILPLPSRAQLDFYHRPHSPEDLTSHWQYRWGVSPLNSRGVPLWVTDHSAGGSWRRFDVPGQPENPLKLDHIWVRVTLPDQYWDDPGLLFITNDQRFRVFLDDRIVYQYGDWQAKKPKQPGSPWHIIRLPEHYEGKPLVFEMKASLVRMAGLIRTARLGSCSDLQTQIVRDSIDYLLLAGLFIFLGFGLLVIFGRGSWDQKSIMTLGFSSICAGLWLTSETNMRQMLFDLPIYQWTYLAIGSFYLLPVGFCAFVEQIFGDRHRFILRKLWQSYIGFFIVTFSLDICGVIPLVATLSTFYLLLLITMVLLVIIVGQAGLKGNSEARIIGTGFTIFASAGLYDILGWYFRLVPWSRYLTHWGLFVFMLFLVYLLRHRYTHMYRQLSDYSKEIEAKNEELNGLWLKVKDSRDQIEQWSKTLEQRVIERTRQLETANHELKVTLKTLRNTQARLVQSEKMSALGSLVAGVAHEINTPLGIGITAVSHLDQQFTDVRELFESNRLKRSDLEKHLELGQEMSRSTLTNLERAADLVKSFKQVAVDQESEIKRRFKVREYLEEVLLSLKPQLKKTSHHIVVQCPEDLEIDSYPGTFSQIVTNLVMNSLLHAFDETGNGTIAVSIVKNENWLTLRYSDNGRGMDPQVQNRIFDPFFTTKRGQGGTGLGLHIVFNIVTQTLGGTIDCQSEPCQGTTFIIHFPVEGGDCHE